MNAALLFAERPALMHSARTNVCRNYRGSKKLVALNFLVAGVFISPRRPQKHRQHKRDENHEENGRQQDRHCQSRAATCMSAFTAKPPGTMRENRRLCLSAPNYAARGAEAASLGPSNRRARHALRSRASSRRGRSRSEDAIINTRAASRLDPDQSSLFHWIFVT